MGRYRIEGGHRLEGRVRVQGSKNAVLPMMAASLLQKGTVILRHCPRIDDVRCMEEILRYTSSILGQCLKITVPFCSRER